MKAVTGRVMSHSHHLKNLSVCPAPLLILSSQLRPPYLFSRSKVLMTQWTVVCHLLWLGSCNDFNKKDLVTWMSPLQGRKGVSPPTKPVPDHAREDSQLHSLVLMCPGSSSLGMASLQRGHFPNPSFLSHSVSRCSVRLDISTTCTQERRQSDFHGAVQDPQTRAALLGPSGF